MKIKWVILLIAIVLLSGCFNRKMMLQSLYNNKLEGVIEDYRLMYVEFEGSFPHAHNYAFVKQDGVWYIERFSGFYSDHDTDLGSRCMLIDFMEKEVIDE